MSRSPVRGAAAAALALALAACGAPAPKEQFFTLAAPNPGVAPPNGEHPSVFVGPVAVPEGVDRSQMVLRTGRNEVDVSDDFRWAEPLRSAVPRVIAETLSRELGSSRVLSSRMAAGTPVDYRVAIEVQRFDSSLGDGATIDALWTVTAAAGARTRNGRSVEHEPATSRDPGAVAAAHGRALERVARAIAGAIRALGKESPEAPGAR